MDVDSAIRDLLARGGSFQSGELSRLTGLTRQALHKHLSRAISEGRLIREGRGRGARYCPSAPATFDRTYPTDGLREDVVAEELAAWLRGSSVARTSCADALLTYALTEFVNNAIDHSGAPEVRVRLELEDDIARLAVEDDGIGALESVRAGLRLDDHLHALQELSKGKVTTQPDRHSGEGLFFASKMADRFRLAANGFEWIVDNTLPDHTVREVPTVLGTRVVFEVSTATERTTREVFDRYTHDFVFDTSRCVIRLFEYGRSFVSRSEAKRLVLNLERFREVVLDFRGVESVGQGFVDEVFRVWARAHPDVRLVPQNMNSAVEFMVRRGLARAAEDERRPPRS